jgi:hypothetical protein
MKSVSALLCFITVLLSSFTSQPSDKIMGKDPVVKNAFSTSWETDITWNESATQNGKIYFNKRSLPEINTGVLENGYVLAFIKGYNFSNMPLTEKPVALPFEFFQPDETKAQSISWKLEKNAGEVLIALYLNEDMVNQFQQFQKGIQVRYFVLTPQFLKQHRLTQQQAHQLSYTKLVSLLQVEP